MKAPFPAVAGLAEAGRPGSATPAPGCLVIGAALCALILAARGAAAPVAFFPARDASSVCPDTHLRIEFGEPVQLARTGRIQIRDAGTGAVVETIDLADEIGTESVGQLDDYAYYPVMAETRSVEVFPRDGELAYGKSYEVSADAGCFTTAAGPSAAIAGWKFSTRASAPQAGASRFVVASDGTGDFSTVQGAFNYIPSHNTAPVTVFVKRGTYTELVYLGGKANVTLQGEDRAQTVIAYPDNARLNPAGGPYHRGMFLAENADNLVISNLTLRNTTPQGGTQAEALIIEGRRGARAVIDKVDLYSFQDTLQINGKAYLKDCHIEGDVDFMWGTGPCYFDHCECLALRSNAYYTQIRNPGSNHGYVYAHCTFDGLPGAMGNYLSRIAPAVFPHSEVVLIDCVLTDAVGTSGWLLQGPGSAEGVRFLEAGSRDLSGRPVELRWRAAHSGVLHSQADDPRIEEYSDPKFVLGGWDPSQTVLPAPPKIPDQGPDDAPQITTAPANTLALLGTRPILAVAAEGPGPLRYQWWKDGERIAGATGPALRLGAATWSGAGIYEVTVTNGAGSVTSGPARLTVIAPAVATAPRLPAIPDRVFVATKFGMAAGEQDNTAALQQIIDAAAKAGGGVIEIPAAKAPYLCGPIQLQSHLRLQLDPGATLRLLPYGRYPLRDGVYPTFIAARDAHDLAITGGGTIDGQGARWWRAFRSDPEMGHRPFMIRLDRCQAVLVSGVTLVNSPMFHAALGGIDQLTVFDVKVSADPNSPNTDGIDPSGTHQLIQNCVVSCGDDNIAVKAGGAFCSDLTVTDCWFGAGHGVSVGGQSTRGLDGMTVKNCTFHGTVAALRLKADPTQGGAVKNVRYSNLRMTGCLYPFVFYSYYNRVGNPGAVAGRLETTPERVKEWNARPPNPLTGRRLPSWKDITIENVTADRIGGWSIVWGLPLQGYLIEGVKLKNVRFGDGPGLEIYDAADVQFLADTLIPNVRSVNALAIIQQPRQTMAAIGGTATFEVKAVGAEATWVWTHGGAPLADGPQPDGSVVTGATTATLKIDKVGSAEAGDYVATGAAKLDGFDPKAGKPLPGSIAVTVTSSPAALVLGQL